MPQLYMNGQRLQDCPKPGENMVLIAGQAEKQYAYWYMWWPGRKKPMLVQKGVTLADRLAFMDSRRPEPDARTTRKRMRFDEATKQFAAGKADEDDNENGSNDKEDNESPSDNDSDDDGAAGSSSAGLPTRKRARTERGVTVFEL